MTTDPFTLAVIQSGLDNAAEEMFAVLRKTAMSPIIYEVLDVGTGVTDATGKLVSSGAGIPTFVGVLDKAVKVIVERHGDNLQDGDVFITNDPNHGGVTHLNDVVIAKPVFFEDQCVAWTASIAHWGDIGGKVPGSIASDVTEIFAEGLRLPPVRLFNAGVRNAALFDIIEVNSRLPDFVKGDLWAQIAASNRAEQQIIALFEKYGRSTVINAIASAFESGRARALAGLATLPQGEFAIEEEQDNGKLWRAVITISSDTFKVDLSGNPKDDGGPYNTSRDGAVIACQMIFKALCDPEPYANYGSFSPLEVITEEGTVFHAGPTAPQGYYFENRIRLLDMLWQCMARICPGRLPAGSFASIFGTVIAGIHPDTQRRYTMVEPQMGGWGATEKRDGVDAMFSTNHGNTFNCPIEICEARYGLNVIHKQLAEGPRVTQGFSGGAGVSVMYEARATTSLSIGYTRAKVPVWSLNDRPPGGTNSMTIQRRSGEQEYHQFASGITLEPGDQVLIKTASGGNA
jgi:N-methylhydantoinase B